MFSELSPEPQPEASGCAQIVPVKIKFSQILPKISKIAVKISCIIKMLKLNLFLAIQIYD
jgi:hypothetical protein